MAITKKKKNKFIVPQEYNQSVIFARGGNLYSTGGLQTDFNSSAAGQFAVVVIAVGLDIQLLELFYIADTFQT